MKIYFTGAISTKDSMGGYYEQIVLILEKLGHTVVYKHILDKSLGGVMSESPEDHEKYYKWMTKQVNDADLLVAEVSFPSTVHVGHELTLALEKDKPVLALFIKGRRPVLFWGITSDKFYSAEYSSENIEEVVKQSLDYLSDQQDTRFNFFISPRIGNYLNYVSKKKRVPRAVYLRRLIEEDMKKNKEFEE